MRHPNGAVLWLAALGLAVGGSASRAAVMTGKITEAGAGPYKIGYVLAQDAKTMTLIIHQSDGSTVATIPVTDPAALAKGAHDAATSTVAWDGNTSGSPAPAGQYYPEIVTTADPVAAFTLLSGPTLLATDPNGVRGLSLYGGDANLTPASPYHNIAYFGVGNSAYNGVTQVYPDASSALLFKSGTTLFDYCGATVLGDDTVVAGNQITKAFKVIDPATGSVLASYGAVAPDVRWLHGFGSGATARIYYIDDSATGGISLVDPISATAKVNIIPQTSLPAAARGLAVKKDQSALWVSGVGYVLKFVNSGGTWTQDTNFSLTVNAGNYRGLALSPDENTLYVTNNGGSNSLNAVRSYDANNANAAEIAKYDFSPTNPLFATTAFQPQGIAVTSSGDIYVTGGGSTTTGNSVAVLAPPDNGSTDSTRGPAFTVSATVTNISVTNVVENATYHDNTITWTTNVPSDSVITYGTSAATQDKTVSSNLLTTAHSLLLPNLAPNTTYYYTITSSAPGANTGTVSGRSFTTHALAISGAQVSAGPTTATITWTTNEAANTIVKYGTTPGTYDKTFQNDTATTTHTAVITGLTPGTPYYYVLQSGWPGGAAPVATPEASFTTANGTVLITSESLNATTSSATLLFTTDNAATFTVKYGTATNALNSTATVTGNGTTSLSAAFNGLTAGTTYYYSLTATDAAIAQRAKNVGVFTTPISSSTTATLTQSKAADIALGRTTNIVVGGTSLLSLERQGVPGTPEAGPALPVENYYSGVAVHNNVMYVVGGYNNLGQMVNTVYYCPILANGSLDATTGWKATTPLPQAIGFIGDQVFGYNGYVYVVGGNNGAYINTVVYAKQNADGTLGAWQTGPSLPAARGFASAIPVDGNVLVSGGFDVTDRATNFVAQIHPDGSLGPWFNTNPLSIVTDFQRTRANNHTVYSIGGLTTDAVQASTVQPNGDLTESIQNSTLTANPWGAFAAGLLRGKLVGVAGRYGGSTVASNVVAHTRIDAAGTPEYWMVDADATTNTTNAYPVSVLDLDGKAYQGNMYIAGGRQAFSGTAPNAVKNTVVLRFTNDPDTSVTYAYAGTFESPIIDLGSVSALKGLTVSGTGLTGSSLELRYRFAKDATSASGDPVFTDWFTATGASATITGGARYFQYEIVLKGDGTTTPTVTGVTLTTATGVVALSRADAITALQIAGGLIQASGADKQRLNVNGDNVVNLQDAVKILRQVSGL